MTNKGKQSISRAGLAENLKSKYADAALPNASVPGKKEP